MLTDEIESASFVNEVSANNILEVLQKSNEKIHPNVKINIINNPWDGFWTKLPLALQKGSEGPTLFNVIIAISI